MLNVGDIIYEISNGITDRLVIDRVTDNYAFAKTTKFTREYSDGNWLRTLPREAYPMYHYKLEIPELKEQYEKLILINKLKKVDLLAIPNSVLEKVLEILNEKL